MKRFFITVTVGYAFIGVALFILPHTQGRWDSLFARLNRPSGSGETQGAAGHPQGKGRVIPRGTQSMEVKQQPLPSRRLFDGIFRTAYSNGKVSSEWSYKEGSLEGLTRLYYENGNVWREVRFVQGMAEGEEKVFYPDGKLQSKVNYRRGRPDGTSVDYYANGSPWVEWVYVDGLISGMPKIYAEDGRMDPQIAAYHMAGRPSGQGGVFRAYSETGELKAEWHAAGEQEVNTAQTHFRNGVVSSVWDFQEGRIAGPVSFYYPNGDLWKEIPFLQGRMSGPVKTFYPGGRLWSEIPHASGRPEGIGVFYYPDGRLWAEISFKEGRMAGTPRAYSQKKDLSDGLPEAPGGNPVKK